MAGLHRRAFFRSSVHTGLGLLVFAILSGCAATQHREQMNAFSASWEVGDFTSAAYGQQDSEQRTFDPETIESMDLFELLHFAEAARLSGDQELAIEAFDRTEEVFKRFDEENVAGRSLGQMGAILAGESVRAYRGHLYEAVLVNTYKAMTFLSTADNSLARVEFNRADDRTRRAVEFFADEIEEQQQVDEEKHTTADKQEEPPSDQQQSVAATMASEESKQALYEAYGNPSEWAVYPDFVNPFVTYLHGLYFLSQSEQRGDIERAVESLDRVHGMTENPVVAADLELANALASGALSRSALPSQVWVIYENGIGPTLTESRFDIPLFLVTQGRAGQPTLAGIALPKVERGRAAHQNLSIHAVGPSGLEPVAQSHTLADMQRVLNTEFQHNFDGILGRAITSTVVDLLIQSEATSRAGLLGAFASTVLTQQTNKADLRIWRALPDHWQVARFERPVNGKITLLGDDSGPLVNLTVPDWPYTLVYVKQPTRFASPAVKVIDLQGRNPALGIGQGVPDELVAAP
jgi:hypothetical protein